MKAETSMIRTFNLIEIVLAMAILGVGVASVVGMFPVAIQSSKDSIAENYTADAADQMLSQIARMFSNDWSGSKTAIDESIPGDPTTQDYTGWTNIPETNLYSTGSTDLYGIKQMTGANIDFSGNIKLWRSKVTIQKYSGGAWTSDPDSSYASAARINIELSWPVEKPYSKRNKRLFCLDVFRND